MAPESETSSNVLDSLGFDLLSPSFILLCLFVFFLVKALKLFSRPASPLLVYQTTSGNRIPKIIGLCPKLKELYDPPALWGRSGHIQTITYGWLGHQSLKRTSDARHTIPTKDSDGTTVTFDVFEPLKQHSEGDFTFVLCPGIANHCESTYIRTFFHYAQEAGFRCVVMNHLGALRDVKLTSNKLFTYGGMREFEAVMEAVFSKYPDTQVVVVGFSMGANIVCRYLGLLGDSPRVLCGISVCQGFDCTRAVGVMHSWEGLRRLYMYIMAENMKRLLKRNYAMAVGPHVQSGLVDPQKLFAATSLIVIDEQYSRKVAGFNSLEEYYRVNSSIHSFHDIKVPTFVINAMDDPLVPASLCVPVMELAGSREDFLFVSTKHGGHLGFLEGTSLSPKSVTWLDRVLVELAEAAIQIYRRKASSAL